MTYRSLPVWLQWLLPFSIAAIVFVALILFVHHQTDDVPAIASVNGKAAAVQNQEDRTIGPARLQTERRRHCNRRRQAGG
jgi:fatty acid desaturase